ncbi:MAG: hypothetical protein ACOX8U_02565 [Bradymonadia bacterium]|jgi:hypothetical protein
MIALTWQQKFAWAKAHVLAVLLILIAVCACETHDYWQLQQKLEVNSDESVLSAKLDEPLSQELFVRYALDYEITNESAKQTQVVVGATTYVNNTVRARGQKVWTLEPNASMRGNLGTTQLEIGNAIDVRLECCESSSCTPREVLCPQIDASLLQNPNNAELMELTQNAGMTCFRSCQRAAECSKQCPAEASCDEECEGSLKPEKCKQENCLADSGLATCSQFCGEDIACLQNCVPNPSCVDHCYVQDTACFGNCLSFWTRCTGKRYYPPLIAQDQDWLPCAMCGAEGKCGVNWERSEELFIYDSQKQPVPCDLRCDRYPSACTKACKELHAEEEAQATCSALCIEQHLYWCNNFYVADDYLDSKHKQPCCYGTYCHNSLQAVLKTYEVRCFNDAECGVGRRCSPQGVCIDQGQSASCSVSCAPITIWHALFAAIMLLALLRSFPSFSSVYRWSKAKLKAK